MKGINELQRKEMIKDLKRDVDFYRRESEKAFKRYEETRDVCDFGTWGMFKGKAEATEYAIRMLGGE